MSYDMYGQEVGEPEEAQYVDAPQTPAVAKQWSWNSTSLLIAGGLAAAVGLVLYFIWDFTKVRNAATAVVEAANGEGA